VVGSWGVEKCAIKLCVARFLLCDCFVGMAFMMQARENWVVVRAHYTSGLLFFFVGLPVANAPVVPQPCGLLYYP
jgi:hypothetical protein